MNHYVYEITNSITKDKYIGIRECECDIDKDRYKGENTILLKEFKKYGKKNFSKRILAIVVSNKMKKELFELYLKYSDYILLEENNLGDFTKKRSNTGAKNGASRKVICLNTEEIFDTVTEASQKYNINKTSIIQACNPKYKVTFAGKNKDGEKLKWDYYDAYLAKLNGEEYNYDTSKMSPKKTRTKPVRCIETGEVFNSFKEASEKYSISSASISNSCTTGNHAGKHPVTGAPLKWEYVNKEDNPYYIKID